MIYITLQTELTETGIICSHPTLGKVAAIKRDPQGWLVLPYRFPPSERKAAFRSLQAAEYYALALAYEQHETFPP